MNNRKKERGVQKHEKEETRRSLFNLYIGEEVRFDPEILFSSENSLALMSLPEGLEKPSPLCL